MLATRFTKSPTRFSLLLLAILLSSCSRVRVISPLCDPDKSKLDERLCGAWKWSKDNNEDADDTKDVFLIIGKVNKPGVPSGIMKAVLIGLDSENSIDLSASYFSSTRAGDNNYVHLFEEAVFKRATSPAWDKRKIQPFDLYKYAIAGDKLTLWLRVNDDAVEAAVRKGQVKGTIEEKEGNSSKKKIVTLTDGRDLLRFLKNGGDKVIFDESKLVFIRIKQ